jgi:hypothetical protein
VPDYTGIAQASRASVALILRREGLIRKPGPTSDRAADRRPEEWNARIPSVASSTPVPAFAFIPACSSSNLQDLLMESRTLSAVVIAVMQRRRDIQRNAASRDLRSISGSALASSPSRRRRSKMKKPTRRRCRHPTRPGSCRREKRRAIRRRDRSGARPSTATSAAIGEYLWVQSSPVRVVAFRRGVDELGQLRPDPLW